MTQRIQRHPFLAIFDGADTNASTPQRITSTTPLQALFLLNDPFVHEQAKRFAERVLRSEGDDEPRIDRAYRARCSAGSRRERRAGALDVFSDVPQRSCRRNPARRGEDVGPRRGRALPRAVPEQRVRLSRLSVMHPGLVHLSDIAAASSHSLAAAARCSLPGILLRAADRLAARLAAATTRSRRRSRTSAPKAKRVIFLFSTGGVSHMDTFDPKPKLFAADGKTTGVGGGLSNQQAAAAQAALGRSSRAASAARWSATCSRTSASAWTTSA